MHHASQRVVETEKDTYGNTKKVQKKQGREKVKLRVKLHEEIPDKITS